VREGGIEGRRTDQHVEFLEEATPGGPRFFAAFEQMIRPAASRVRPGARAANMKFGEAARVLARASRSSRRRATLI